MRKATHLITLIPLVLLSLKSPCIFAEENLDFMVFPLSTEIQIGKIQKFLLDAPSGIYFTVGAERGFKAAAMMPNIHELWLIDIAEEIIRFNKINTLLLKTPNRLTYLKLRWESNFGDWQQHNVDLTQNDFDWWTIHVRQLDNLDYALPEYLNKFHRTPPCAKKNNPNSALQPTNSIDLEKIIDYKQGNYLFNDTLYARLNQLALNNKIYTEKLDLSKKNSVEKIKEKLKTAQQPLSILDLNNLYYSSYMGEEKYIELIQQLLPYGQTHSMLIVMSNYKKLACAQFQIYLGFTFGHIKTWPIDFKMQFFIDSIPEEVSDLIDGKLYTERDLLPVFKKQFKKRASG